MHTFDSEIQWNRLVDSNCCWLVHFNRFLKDFHIRFFFVSYWNCYGFCFFSNRFFMIRLFYSFTFLPNRNPYLRFKFLDQTLIAIMIWLIFVIRQQIFSAFGVQFVCFIKSTTEHQFAKPKRERERKKQQRHWMHNANVVVVYTVP